MDLILSDIHADIRALEAILDVVTHTSFKEKYGEFSRIINLGDILERGTHPKEVLEKLQIISKTHSLESVIGNHDEAFLYKRSVSGSSIESLDAHSSLNQQDLEFFEMNKDGTYGKQELIDKKYNSEIINVIFSISENGISVSLYNSSAHFEIIFSRRLT